tara:strand:- start:83 stop:685 length:603 start_codon:yes stop_codon:yes gene_type:complete
MAFKMNRPLKMKGPKKSVLNLGRATGAEDSGLYYNSSMGPMKMHSPSALKQMEEMGDMGGMEEMMGMMGGGAPAEGPVEGAPVEKEGGGDKKPQTITFDETEMEGGDMGEVKQDESGTFVIIPNEDGLGDFPPNTKVIIPEAMIAETGAEVGELLTGGDYTATLNANGEYELTSNDADLQPASQENELERQPAENADEID